MRKYFILFAFCIQMLFSAAFAQSENLKTTLYNSENNVVMKIDLYEESVTVPGQELLGKTYGYIKRQDNSVTWMIMDVRFKKTEKVAELDFVSDTGADDLVATLTLNKDGSYTLVQGEGSTIKLAKNGKWIKLPKVITLQKKQ